MKNYIICTTQRSGSTMLCSLLKQTNKLGKPTEGLLFLEMSREALGVKQKILKDMSLLEGINHTKSWLKTDNNVIGLKLMASTLKHVYLGICKDGKDYPKEAFKVFEKQYKKPVYIFLRRKNKIKQAISHSYLRKTGFAHALNETQLLKLKDAKSNVEITNVDVDFDLNRIFKDELLWKTYFVENDIKPIIINFEDLLVDKNICLEKITQALDIGETISFNDIKARTKKLSDPSEQLFLNQYIKRLKDNYTEEQLSLYDIEVTLLNQG